MSTPITVIGIGEDGLDGLTAPACRAVQTAQVLAGGARHLKLVPDFTGPRVDWSDGIEAGLDAIAEHVHAGRNVCVLASGDPLYFGVGKNLVARFGAINVRIMPTPGAVSLACAAMGWSHPDVTVITLHGRPLETLNLHLAPGQRIVALTHDGATPNDVAKLLCAQGYGPSHITVLERLGGPHQARIDATAQSWNKAQYDHLNTLAVELIADADARPLSRLAGLPDVAYQHDGQLTKRAVRAVTLSSLAPLPGETLWDLGAGAGSISIEWLRSDDTLSAIAIERNPLRAARIRANANALGVPRLRVFEGDSFDALSTLDGQPDAIFVGGAVAQTGLLDAAWAKLKPAGRLVANAVTEASAQAVQAFQSKHGGERFTITVEAKRPIVHLLCFKPRETIL